MTETSLAALAGQMASMAASGGPPDATGVLANFLRLAMDAAGAETGCVALREATGWRSLCVGRRSYGGVVLRRETAGLDVTINLPEALEQRIAGATDAFVDIGADDPGGAEHPFLPGIGTGPTLCRALADGGGTIGALFLAGGSAQPPVAQEVTDWFSVVIMHAVTLHRLHAKEEALMRENRRLVRSSDELSLEHQILQTLVDHMPQRIYAKDRTGKFVFANRAVARGMGCERPEDLLGKSDLGFYPQEEALKYLAEEREIMRSARPMINHEEHVQYVLTGTEGWMLTTKVPLRDRSGEIIGLVGINQDITERKAMEKALREARQPAQRPAPADPGRNGTAPPEAGNR